MRVISGILCGFGFVAMNDSPGVAFICFILSLVLWFAGENPEQ